MRPARSRPRRLALAAAGVVLAASAAACSDDGDNGGDAATPDSGAQTASVEEFCGEFNGLLKDLLSQADGADRSQMIRTIKQWAADMEQLGPPADMPEDARRGFQLFLDQAENLDEDASLKELQRLLDDLSQADQADGRAFAEWVRDNCPLDLPSR